MVKRYDYMEEYGDGYIAPSADGYYVEYDDYEALEARIAELEKDAARYRVVRDRILPEELNFDSPLDESIGDEAISSAVDMAVDKFMSREA